MMSAWIAVSSAPGTLYSSLRGMIMPATVQRSSCWAEVRAIDIISSIKEIGEALLHLIGDVERDGLNGGCRVDAARSNEHAAIDDEKIFYVVRAAPLVHHGAIGIGAHARGAEQVPAAIGNRHVEVDVAGAGGGQNLLAARNPVLQHFLAVLADGIVDARRRNAVAVLQDRIEPDAVVLFRKVLADRRRGEPVAVELAEYAVVIRAPRQNALAFAHHGLEYRPDTAAELDAVTAHKTARKIGFIKFLTPQAGRRRAIAVGSLIDIAVDLRVGMEHQVLADQSARIGEPVGKTAGG